MERAEANREKFNLSWRMNGVSRDLLHKYMNQNNFPNENEQKEAEEDEELELSLGLSMNGRFGVDPARKKLRRSSSVSNLVSTVGSIDSGSGQQAREVVCESYAPLVRASSLPTETEEWRRRQKELQSVRCMEARKKRMEKLKNVRVVKDKESCSEDVHNGNGLQLHDDVSGSVNVQRLDSGTITGLENWNLVPSSQWSIGSRSGSSGISDLQSQLMEGAKQNSGMKTPSGLPFQQEPGMERPVVRAADRNAKRDDELLKNALLDMPYVSTRGYGPNFNKIQGFLYRYHKGEEVKIVCVCHGLFLSPAEFVKHGGGGDVVNPLKHIVVNPFPLF